VTKEEEEETLTAPTPKKKVVVAPPEDGGVGEAAKESRYPTRERRPLGEWWMNHILPQDQVERANVAFLRDPSTVEEAMRSANASKWELAMQAEYASLMSKGTWELAPLPTGRKSVGCKWVFCTKRDALGSVVRYKARLVAKGYS
jgi:hypothetical protein